MSVRLLTWNVAGRKKLLADQLKYVAGKGPDLVCLQEITRNTIEPWMRGLESAGLNHVAHTISDDHPTQGPRRYGLLIATRKPLKLCSFPSIPWPARLLGVTTQVGLRDCTILTTHIPPGAGNGWVKVDMLEAVADAAKSATGALVLCGDFNCPQQENPDGMVITWGQTIRKDGAFRVQKGYERWDSAERGIIEGLPAAGLIDVPRLTHGAEAEIFSYFDIRKGAVRASRRYDHLFASESLNPTWSEYDDTPRSNGLSDHAALLVDFASLA